MAEQDDFFVVDFSKYTDPWSKVGESEVRSSPGGASPLATNEAPTATEGEEEEESFIPSSWRDAAFEIEVERAVRQAFIQEAAEHKKREIQNGRIELPPIYLLAAFLEQEDNPVRYVIEDLWPIGGNVLFAAPAKFGKSTVTMNLVRSLLDGTAFLDHFAVDPILPDEGILLVDLEMSEDRVRREIRIQNIENQAGLHVVPMRGLTGQLDLFNPETRKLWVNYCKAHKIRTLIIDPLAPLFGYLGVEENDNTAVNKFFQVLDQMKKEAGIRDLLVTHHSGHTADWRPRGASRFNDWPDALWLAKVEDILDPQSPRLFFARGRDVGDTFNGPGSVTRDAVTRRLSFTNDVAAANQVLADRGLVSNVVFTRQGQVTRDLLNDLRTAGVQGATANMTELLDDMQANEELHSHPGPGRGGPVHWFTGRDRCTFCNPPTTTEVQEI